MLTASPSRQHQHRGRTAALVVLVLAVLAGAAAAGWQLHSTSADSRPPAKSTRAATVRPSAAPSSSLATPSPGAVPFLALPVGAPPSGAGDAGYPWHRLVATIAGPDRVSAGSTAAFTIRLHNPTSAAIALSPCPSYDLTVGVRTTSYGLNCGPVPAIAAGATVAYALPVPFPGSLSGSRVSVSWSLGWSPDRSSPSAHEQVTIE